MVMQVTNIKRHFQMGDQVVEALRGITFDVKEGEFISIMGPSGSGKTTLMNIIGCLDTPTSGEYKLNNKLVNSLNENELAKIRNNEIGFVFQCGLRDLSCTSTFYGANRRFQGKSDI